MIGTIATSVDVLPVLISGSGDTISSIIVQGIPRRIRLKRSLIRLSVRSVDVTAGGQASPAFKKLKLVRM